MITQPNRSRAPRSNEFETGRPGKKGKAKEGVDSAADDRELEVEGQGDQTEGNVKQAPEKAAGPVDGVDPHRPRGSRRHVPEKIPSGRRGSTTTSPTVTASCATSTTLVTTSIARSHCDRKWET